MHPYSKKSEFPESKLKLILALKLHVPLLPRVMVSHFLYTTALHIEMSAVVMLF